MPRPRHHPTALARSIHRAIEGVLIVLTLSCLAGYAAAGFAA